MTHDPYQSYPTFGAFSGLTNPFSSPYTAMQASAINPAAVCSPLTGNAGLLPWGVPATAMQQPYGATSPQQQMQLAATLAGQSAWQNPFISAIQHPLTAVGQQNPFINAGLQNPFVTGGQQNPFINAGLQHPFVTASLQNPFISAGLQNPYATGVHQNPFVTAGLQNPFITAGLQNPYAAGVQQNPFITAGLQNPYATAGLQNPFVTAALQNPLLNPVLGQLAAQIYQQPYQQQQYQQYQQPYQQTGHMGFAQQGSPFAQLNNPLSAPTLAPQSWVGQGQGQGQIHPLLLQSIARTLQSQGVSPWGTF